MEERQRVQEVFAREARILISTNPGGEGRAGAPQPGATVVGEEGQHTIWRLVWPDGHEHTGCFTHRVSSMPHLGLEEPRIRGLAMRLPQAAPGPTHPYYCPPRATHRCARVVVLMARRALDHGLAPTTGNGAFPP